MWRYNRLIEQDAEISTHTSRVGCDVEAQNSDTEESVFLLTHPVWDVTYCNYNWGKCSKISTHTSRVGCDFFFLDFASLFFISTHTSRVGCDFFLDTIPYFSRHFYSHIPCGMWPRTEALILLHLTWHFYSHIPCGMWQFCLFEIVRVLFISTHTSRVGCDKRKDCPWINALYFYSHIPCGMWRVLSVVPSKV